jgi:predicted membrane chloride channel (bestrophin family)
MVIWLMASPVIYTPDLQWVTPLVCFLIGYSLLGMEAISMEVRLEGAARGH